MKKINYILILVLAVATAAHKTSADADTTLPSIIITNPTAGVEVGGTVNITADASDNVGVVGVQFKINNQNVGSEDTSAPYSYSWDTRNFTNTSQLIVAVARDAAGNTKTSPLVPVTVYNPAQTPPPPPPPVPPPPPSSPQPLVGDINLDHIVNSIDWSTMNSHWLTADGTLDLNHDGIVNGTDFSIMNSNWLKTW